MNVPSVFMIQLNNHNNAEKIKKAMGLISFFFETHGYCVSQRKNENQQIV